MFRNKTIAVRQTPLISLVVSLVAGWACTSTHYNLSPTSAPAGIQSHCPVGKVLASEQNMLGPYQYEVKKNVPLTLRHSSSASSVLVTDVFSPHLPAQQTLATAVFLHGNHSRKEAHYNQAAFAASWGYQAITVQLPNEKRWFQNGEAIAKFIGTTTQAGQALPKHRHRVSSPPPSSHPIHGKVILIGHSFGSTAAAYAASRLLKASSGAPPSNHRITGLILLDPAMYKQSLIPAIKNIKVATVILGADEKVFKSKRRSLFAKNLPSEVIEVSVAGATHDDAQFPSMFSIYAAGFDPYTSTEKQVYFRNLITATILSMTCSSPPTNKLASELHTGALEDGLKLQRLWSALQPDITNSRLSKAKYKN